MKAHGPKPFGVLLDRVPVEIKTAKRDALGTFDISIEVRNRKATFVPFDRALGFLEFRVDHDKGVGLLVLFTPLGIDHDQPDVFSQLRRGESDAGFVVHHLAHVLRQLTMFFGHVLDRATLLLESAVGELKDFSKRHEFFIACLRD